MLREKRIRKEPIFYPVIYPEPRKSSTDPSKKQRKRKKSCQFKVIPPPSKFINNFKIYSLPGDVFLMEKNNIISFEISLLSRVKLFRNIEVIQKAATRAVKINAEPKENIQSIEWKEIINKLESSNKTNLKVMRDLIAGFCRKYENFIKKAQEKDFKFAKNQEEEELFRQITTNSELKKSHLLEFLPCIYIKSCFEESDFVINEITFNELIVRDLGYSIDSFVTSVFQEGIPQFASHDSEAILNLTKILLENYFTIGPEGIVTPESDILLFMKSGYVRKARVQTYFLMNYEGGGFGIDILITILSKEEPSLGNGDLLKNIVNSEFIQEMATKETNLADFLSIYYDKASNLIYNNFEKVCCVRELHMNQNENF